MNCPECATEIAAPKPRQIFCTPAHKAAFYNIQSKRGRVIMPLLAAWRPGGSGGGRYVGADKDMGSYAFREACALVDQWDIEDRKAGRDPTLVVAGKYAIDWRAGDLGCRSSRAA